MVILKSSNRFLTKVEIEHDLKSLGYENPSVLRRVLAKYGYSEDFVWKKDRMDRFRNEIEKERKKLDDLFSINFELNREIYDKKYKEAISKRLFVIRERYFNFDFKIRRLKSLIKVLEKKSKNILDFLYKEKANSREDIF